MFELELDRAKKAIDEGMPHDVQFHHLLKALEWALKERDRLKEEM
jgi:hypothetical protein